LERLHAELLRGALQANRTGGFFSEQKKASLFLGQLITLAAQVLSLITQSQRSKMLPPGVNKTACQTQTAKQQQAEPQEGVTIVFAGHACIALFRGKASNHFGLQQVGPG